MHQTRKNHESSICTFRKAFFIILYGGLIFFNASAHAQYQSLCVTEYEDRFVIEPSDIGSAYAVVFFDGRTIKKVISESNILYKKQKNAMIQNCPRVRKQDFSFYKRGGVSIAFLNGRYGEMNYGWVLQNVRKRYILH